MIANIKPGILVALKTTVSGGVEHLREELAPEAAAPEAGSARTHKTTTIVENVEDHESAKVARSAARSTIARVCVLTDFGLLCPAEKEADLDEAIDAAQEMADKHNASSDTTRVSIFVMKGRVAETDDEAARGIAAEVRGLLETMDRGVAEGNVEAVRAAANRARKLTQVLDESAGNKLADAVAEARDAAREIVKRVIDGGEALEIVVREIKTEARDTARFAFLDTGDEPAPVAAIAEPLPLEMEVV